MAVRNTRSSQDKRRKDSIRRAETASPSGYSSVTEGQFRVASDEGLRVEGSQRVTGRLYIDGVEIVDGQLRVNGSLVLAGNADFTGPVAVRGTLRIDGSTTFIGPLRIEGTSTIVGEMKIEGNVTITGKTVVTGDFDLKGTLRVQADGSIIVEGPTPMTIGKLNNGQAGINFGSSVLYSDGTRTAIRANNALVGAEPSGAQVTYAGNGFRAESGGSFLAGIPAAPSSLATFGLRIGADGHLYRTATSTTNPGDGGGGPIDA